MSGPSDQQSVAPSPSSLMKGKVALVTGADRGLGTSIDAALELATRGASVAVQYANSRKSAENVASHVRDLGRDAIIVKCNVSRVTEIRNMFHEVVNHFGRLDIVVSNAGINSFSHLKDTEEAEFDSVFGVNAKGQYFVAQEAFRNLNEGGHIILMSSRTTQGRGFGSHAVYAGSKAAIEAFVRCMAVDCGDKKITINAIAPGPTDTDQIKSFRKYIPNSEHMTEAKGRELMASWHPLQRIGEPVDIGRVVAFLAADDGRWINGQVIAADGGVFRRRYATGDRSVGAEI